MTGAMAVVVEGMAFMVRLVRLVRRVRQLLGLLLDRWLGDHHLVA